MAHLRSPLTCETLRRALLQFSAGHANFRHNWIIQNSSASSALQLQNLPTNHDPLSHSPALWGPPIPRRG